MKNITLIILLTLSISILFSCTKWDEFKKYINEGEVTYSGKMDSIKIYSGKERVMLYGLLKGDPKINKVVVSWDNDADSVVYDYAKPTSGIDTFIRTFPVSEGVKSFKILTYDIAGNKSVDVYAVGTSYGNNFRKRMSDRLITALSYSAAGTTINWDQMDLSAGPQYTEIEYMHDGVLKKVTTPISEATTILAGVSVVPPIKYRTVFKPDATSIDTLSTPYSMRNVLADVTGLYLANYGPGFKSASVDGRWGTLAAPWITNAGAKNKGANGGLTIDSRWDYSGHICWETWGNTPVVDGKVHQVTSAPLPAGSYTVTFRYFSELQSNSSMYCIAAAGSDGIPSLPNLSSALGYSALYNGVPVGSTSPNLDDTRSFTFTLNAPQYVSIGFLANIVGNGNPGSYIMVRHITLIKN